jgi:hypothetical protein
MARIHLEANHSEAACTWHATCDNPGQLEHQHNQKRDQKTNQLQTKKNQTGKQYIKKRQATTKANAINITQRA